MLYIPDMMDWLTLAILGVLLGHPDAYLHDIGREAPSLEDFDNAYDDACYARGWVTTLP